MGRRKSRIQLNYVAVNKYMQSRGIREPKLADDLDIDYSYLYRLLRGQRNIGLNGFLAFQKYFEERGMDYRDFIIELEEDDLA